MAEPNRNLVLVATPRTPFEAAREEAAHQATVRTAVSIVSAAESKSADAKAALKGSMAATGVEREKLMAVAADQIRRARADLDMVAAELGER